MTAAQLNLLAVNEPDLPDLFFLDDDQVREALELAPDLLDRVNITVCMRDNTLHQRAASADGIIGWDFDHRRVVEVAERLRWIHIIGAGYEHLTPLDWLPEGVVLTNSSGVHRERAGEYAAGALLMLNSRIPQHMTSQRKHQWNPVFSDTIEGKTVAIVGVGRIGSEVARRASQLDLTVRGVRTKSFEDPNVDEPFTSDELDAALDGADFLVLTAALTEETRGMIGAEALKRLKPGAGVVNISRAGLMEDSALIEALGTGHLRGAVIDVFDPEPLPADSELWDCDNLIVTPHVSSDPVDYNRRMLSIVTDNCRRLLNGDQLRNVVNG